jgi:hypothetical protein
MLFGLLITWNGRSELKIFFHFELILGLWFGFWINWGHIKFYQEVWRVLSIFNLVFFYIKQNTNLKFSAITMAKMWCKVDNKPTNFIFSKNLVWFPNKKTTHHMEWVLFKMGQARKPHFPSRAVSASFFFLIDISFYTYFLK